MARGRVTAVLVAAAAAAALVAVAPAVKRTIALGDRAVGDPVVVLSGRGFALDLPKGVWYAARVLSSELTDGGDQTDPDRPTLMHRLVRAGAPGHLFVVSWPLPGGGSLDLDTAAERISRGSSQRLAGWKLLGVAPLPGRGGTRVLHATAVLEGRDTELLWGLFPNGPTVHGVIVAAEAPAFPRLRAEFEGILASFRVEGASSLRRPGAPSAISPRSSALPAPSRARRGTG